MELVDTSRFPIVIGMNSVQSVVSIFNVPAGVVELVDTLDSKSNELRFMSVQVRPPVPAKFILPLILILYLFLCIKAYQAYRCLKFCKEK